MNTITVCRHCRNESEPIEVCARCRGRGKVGKGEHGGDSSKGTGWANYSLVPCPDCSGKPVAA